MNKTICVRAAVAPDCNPALYIAELCESLDLLGPLPEPAPELLLPMPRCRCGSRNLIAADAFRIFDREPNLCEMLPVVEERKDDDFDDESDEGEGFVQPSHGNHALTSNLSLQERLGLSEWQYRVILVLGAGLLLLLVGKCMF